MTILNVLRSGRVKRYHAELLIGEQTTSSHQWGVAMVLLHCWKDVGWNLLTVGLTHDGPEIEIGDIPAPAKKPLRGVLDQLEAAWASEHGFPHESQLSEGDQLRLKTADYLELMWFCLQQKRLGNTHITAVFETGRSYVEVLLSKLGEERWGRASELFDQLIEEWQK